MGVFLPPEIVGRIILYLEPNPGDPTFVQDIITWKYGCLVPYVTISRVWQAEVERKTFKSIHLNSDRFVDAAKILTPVRCRYVRKVLVDVILPNFDYANCTEKEADKEKERNNSVFMYDVRSTLHLLAPWELPCRVSLQFKIVVNCDPERDGGPNLPGTTTPDDNPRIHEQYDIKNSWLRMPKVGHGLPTAIPCVKSLEILHPREEGPTFRTIDPASVCLIASRCNNLCKLYICVQDTVDCKVLGSSQTRQDYAEGIYSLPPTMKELRLYHQLPTDGIDELDPSTLIDIQSNPSDALSMAIFRISRQLEVLEVAGVFSSDIFGPVDGFGKDSTSTPAWPHMKAVSIRLAGAWVTERTRSLNASYNPEIDGKDGQSGEPKQPPDYSRVMWDDDVCNVILGTAARTASRMPCLEEMDIYIGGINPFCMFELGFDNGEQRKLHVNFIHHHPSHQTVSAWKKVARGLTEGPHKSFTIDLSRGWLDSLEHDPPA